MKRTLRNDQTHITSFSPGKLAASLTRGLLALMMIAGFSLAVLAQADDDFLNPLADFASPCTAALYNFENMTSPDNQVPCGPSANTTPSVEIARGMGNSGHIDGCGGSLGTGGSPADVLWVTFVIQEGGSFEWQTVPGADDFYWELWVSTAEVTDPNVNDGCADADLQFLECGTEFTGWKVEATPGADRKWRYYIAFYLRGGDMKGDGVVKIRKSCGEGCNEASTNVDVTISTTEECYNPGDPAITLTALASGGGTMGNPTYPDDYSFSWSTDEITPAITVTPTMETTYSVLVLGPDNCPATDEITIEYDCCEPVPGTISADGALPAICPEQTTLDGISFSTTADPQPTDYTYAFFLVDMNGNIVKDPPETGAGPQFGTSASFAFSELDEGMYTVYGISYKGADAASYVNGFGSLAALEAALAGSDCGALASDGKVTILDLDCGNFPQGAPTPVSTPN